MSRIKCETCNGDGFLEYGGMALEDDEVHKEICFDCDGEGYIDE
jgi:DnaJ-class molecular chaperone